MPSKHRTDIRIRFISLVRAMKFLTPMSESLFETSAAQNLWTPLTGETRFCLSYYQKEAYSVCRKLHARNGAAVTNVGTQILILQLERYKPGQMAAGERPWIAGQKNARPVILTHDGSTILSRGEHEYQLCAVICHQGGTTLTGRCMSLCL